MKISVLESCMVVEFLIQGKKDDARREVILIRPELPQDSRAVALVCENLGLSQKTTDLIRSVTDCVLVIRTSGMIPVRSVTAPKHPDTIYGNYHQEI